MNSVPQIALLACFWSVIESLNEQKEYSSLFQPSASVAILKRGRRVPLQCVMDNGNLVVALLERSPELRRLQFEWVVPWNQTIDPRYKAEP